MVHNIGNLSMFISLRLFLFIIALSLRLERARVTDLRGWPWSFNQGSWLLKVIFNPPRRVSNHVTDPFFIYTHRQPHDTLERVLERGERIELLVDKTDNLNQQAFAFKKRSTALKVCRHFFYHCLIWTWKCMPQRFLFCSPTPLSYPSLYLAQCRIPCGGRTQSWWSFWLQSLWWVLDCQFSR